ncbi:hypothetical protein BJ878DRAFT_565336 [Calycina marina]|uniref:Uncharacterized protein n=1 Tax=Calycina marina TaxID=1763456 RepID=A0A9P8CH59_9HELO|nr:hypothetical protein BJ878DRAFT_565336 [Calycina marina]
MVHQNTIIAIVIVFGFIITLSLFWLAVSKLHIWARRTCKDATSGNVESQAQSQAETNVTVEQAETVKSVKTSSKK